MKRLAALALLGVLLLVAACWLALWSLSGGELGAVLRQRLAAAIGQEVTWDSLDLEILPPHLRVTGLRIGDPLLASAGEVDLRVDVASSLRDRRPHVEGRVRRLYVNADGPDDAAADGGDELGSLVLPPISLALTVEEASVDLSEARSVAVSDASVELGDGARGRRMQLSLNGVDLLRGDERITVEQAALVAELGDGTLSIETVNVRGPDLLITARPLGDGRTAPAGKGIAPTSVEAAGEIGPIIEFFAGEIELSGAADLALTVHGPVADPILDGTARVERVNLLGAELSILTFDVRREAGRWRAGDVAAEMPSGRLIGDLGLDEATWTLSGSAGWRDVDVGAATGVGSDWNARSSGDVALVIEFVDFAFSLKGKGQIGADGTEALPFDIALNTDGERWSGSLDMVVDDGQRLHLRVDRADSAGLAAVADVDIASIERVATALGYHEATPVRGGLVGRAVCSGTVPAPECVVDVVGSNLRLADGTSAELQSRFRLSRGEMVIDSMNFAVGAGRITASGTVALTAGRANEWTLHADDVELAPLMQTLRETVLPGAPEAAGRINGNLEVRGEWMSAQATGGFTVARAAVDERTVGTLGIEVVSVAGEWRIGGEVGGADRGERAVVELRGTGNRVRAIEGFVDRWPLAALIGATATEIGGFVNLSGTIEAVDGGASGRVEASLVDLSIAEQRFGDSRIRANGSGGPWTVDGDLLGDVADLEGRVDSAPSAPFVASIHWRDAVVPAAFTAGEELRITSSGEITVEGLLAELGAADVAMSVQTLDVTSGQDRLTNEGPVRIERDAAGVRLVGFALAGGATRLTATGEALLDGSSRVAVDGTVDLGWLEHLTTTLEAATGTADIAVEMVRAPGGAPRLSGSASIRGAAFEVAGLPPATGVGGDIALSSSQIATSSLSGDLGGGHFEISGQVDLVAGPNLEWSLREVSFEPAERLELVIAGNGTLSGPWDKTLFAGEVVISDLLYDRDLAFQDLIPSFDRAVAPVPARRDARPPLRLDVRVLARDGMYVANNIADLEARTDLKITGSARSPRIRGVVEVVDGRVVVRGRTFEIVTGVLKFQPELRGKAQIDFLAESVIESGGVPYGVQVRVNGMTDDFRVTLDSEDGLSQTDIASLITFGRTMSEMQDGTGAGSGISMDGLMGVAGGQVGKFLSGEVQEALPFDEVELRAEFSPLTGEFEPQLRVGKYITEDLSAWIAQTFGVRSQTSVEMSYALTRQIATTLRWESQTATQEGAFGGEVSQRFQFWGLPAWLQWGPPQATSGGLD